MDIVIIANFCMDFSKTDNGRFSYLANMLSDKHSVEIITSDFYHITKQHRGTVPELPYKVSLLHEPGYSKNISLRRFLSHWIWGINVYKYLKCRKKPDVVYCAIPSLTGPSLVGRYCKKKGIRFIIDIQDLWPEAFQMVFNIPVLSKIAFAPFQLLADSIYRRADAICAVSGSYCKRGLSVKKDARATAAVFLGTELDTFDQYALEKPMITKKENEVWLAYCGTLGKSYDIKCVIDALKILQNEQKSTPTFVIMGDGPEKKSFEEYAKLQNVTCNFTGRLSYDKMCSILARADMVVNPIIGTSVASIINKHADYAASGCPVINTQESKEYRNLVDEYKMGINCENGNPYSIANAIALLMSDRKLRLDMGANARRCAEEKFDRKTSYQALQGVIERV